MRTLLVDQTTPLVESDGFLSFSPIIKGRLKTVPFIPNRAGVGWWGGGGKRGWGGRGEGGGGVKSVCEGLLDGGQHLSRPPGVPWLMKALCHHSGAQSTHARTMNSHANTLELATRMHTHACMHTYSLTRVYTHPDTHCSVDERIPREHYFTHTHPVAALSLVVHTHSHTQTG